MDVPRIVQQIDTVRPAIRKVREEYDVLLELVKDDPKALRLAKEARKMHRGAAMKERLEELRTHVLDPTPSKLRDELTVRGMKDKYGYPIYMSPFLIPSILLNQKISQETLVAFAERMVDNEWGNCIRGFGTCGWESYWYSPGYLTFPYIKLGDKWDCMGENPEYDAMLRRRISIFTDRHITVVLSLGDNCSTQRDAFWNRHFWNGSNNLNKTSTWNNMIYHYYEDEHASKPGATETREVTHAQYRRQIQIAEEFAPWVVYEPTNEAFADHRWHIIMFDLIDREAGLQVPRWRKILSMCRDEFYDQGAPTHLHGNYSLHGIGTYTEYLNRKHLLPNGVHGIMSQDGRPPTKAPSQTSEMVYQILKAGDYGFEQNLRPIWEFRDNNWEKVVGHENWDLELEWEWADAVRDGWFRFLL